MGCLVGWLELCLSVRSVRGLVAVVRFGCATSRRLSSESGYGKAFQLDASLMFG